MRVIKRRGVWRGTDSGSVRNRPKGARGLFGVPLNRLILRGNGGRLRGFLFNSQLWSSSAITVLVKCFLQQSGRV